jgi:hypothetical protein
MEQTQWRLSMFEPLVQFGVNYIVFIMASVGINWRNDYTEAYRNFLSPEGQHTLEINRSHLTFGDGDGGQLTCELFFFPAYLNLETSESARDYYTTLTTAIRSGKWSPFETHYAEPLAHIRAFYPGFLDHTGDANSMKLLADNADALAAVFLCNMERYRQEVWPQDKAMLERVAGRIPTLWGDTDIFAAWEQIVGIKFIAPSYRILLVAAMKGGPNANSLAFDTNTFYADDSPESYHYYYFFFSHEIGTHLLIPEIIKTEEIDNIGYITQENLAKYYNERLLPNAHYEMGGNYHDEYFAALFAELVKKEPAIRPVELYRKVVERARKELQ